MRRYYAQYLLHCSIYFLYYLFVLCTSCSNTDYNNNNKQKQANSVFTPIGIKFVGFCKLSILNAQLPNWVKSTRIFLLYLPDILHDLSIWEFWLQFEHTESWMNWTLHVRHKNDRRYRWINTGGSIEVDHTDITYCAYFTHQYFLFP